MGLFLSKLWLIALTSVLAALSIVSAMGQNLFGNPTNLLSSKHGMISDRFQKHSWFTSDGNLHILIREQQTEPALKLYRAQDSNFTSFGLERDFKGSGSQSTSDGVLINDHLYVVYDTAAGTIVFAELEYSPASFTWALQSSSTVYQNVNGVTAVRPTLAIDSSGKIWVGYVLEGYLDAFKIQASEDGGQSWALVDANLPPPKPTQERSVRLVTGPGVVYALYSDHRSFGLSVLQNSLWNNLGIFFTQAPANQGMLDPHGTHFNTAVDASGNLHFLSNDGNFRGLYIRYNLQSGSRTSPTLIDSTNATMKADYMEIATDQKGQLLAIFAATSGLRNCLVTFRSFDSGDTWTEGAALLPPELDTENPRPEMPANLIASQPVFQQVTLPGGTQSVVSYIVPKPPVWPCQWRHRVQSPRRADKSSSSEDPEY
jgi:hypothetical protein